MARVGLRSRNVAVGAAVAGFAGAAFAFPMWLAARAGKERKRELGLSPDGTVDADGNVLTITRVRLDSDRALGPQASMRGPYQNTGTRDIGLDPAARERMLAQGLMRDRAPPKAGDSAQQQEKAGENRFSPPKAAADDRFEERAEPTPRRPAVPGDVTRSELFRFDGKHDPDGPIFIAIDGTVFDVGSAAGLQWYGPGVGGYEMFAGRDVTLALAKNSLDASLLSPSNPLPDTSVLSPEELEDLQSWKRHFEKKYAVVGKLVD
jgi:predicted heme/steroid binding protein